VNFQVVRIGFTFWEPSSTPRTDIRVVEGEPTAAPRARRLLRGHRRSRARSRARARDIVELPLKHARIFERLGISRPKAFSCTDRRHRQNTARAARWPPRAACTSSPQRPEIHAQVLRRERGKLREDSKKRHVTRRRSSSSTRSTPFAPKRADVAGEVEKRVVAQLLSLMDGFRLARPGHRDGCDEHPPSPRSRASGVPVASIAKSRSASEHARRLQILEDPHTRDAARIDVVLPEIASIRTASSARNLEAWCRKSA